MKKKNVNIGIEARYHYFMRLQIGIKAVLQDYFMFFFLPCLSCFNSNFHILFVSIDPLVDT